MEACILRLSVHVICIMLLVAKMLGFSEKAMKGGRTEKGDAENICNMLIQKKYTFLAVYFDTVNYTVLSSQN